MCVCWGGGPPWVIGYHCARWGLCGPPIVPSGLYPSILWVCPTFWVLATYRCPGMSYGFVCVVLFVPLPLGPGGSPTVRHSSSCPSVCIPTTSRGLCGPRSMLQACLSLCVLCAPLLVSIRLYVSSVSKGLSALGCYACHLCMEGRQSLQQAGVWGKSSILLGWLWAPRVSVWVSLRGTEL